MLKSRVRHILLLLTAVLFAVGCDVVDGGGAENLPNSGKYGTLYFGEEQMPINIAEAGDSGDFLLVMLTPLTDKSNLTTSVMIGLKEGLIGSNVNVERHYCNDDYVVIYEDPQCYYASFRPLQRGSICIKRDDDSVSIDVDVVLYDGTPLRYSQRNVPLKRI